PHRRLRRGSRRPANPRLDPVTVRKKENSLCDGQRPTATRLREVPPHSEVDATYSVIERDGTKTLQINTLGSKNRKIVGKDSQTIRFTADALRQLQRIIKENFDLD